MENISVNFEKKMVEFGKLGIPFSMLGLDAQEPGYNATYTIKGTYEESDGKFSQAYGSVVLLDCDYIVDSIIAFMKQ